MARRLDAFILGAVALAAAAVIDTRPVAAGSSAAPAQSGTVKFVAGSTVKVQQLLGEQDKERKQPTLSRTVTRYGLEGTDLGNSFEHDGRVYFLFGDTVGTAGRALDTIGVTDAREAEANVRLDFLTMDPIASGRRGAGRRGGRAGATPAGDRQYLTIEPPGISMGPFEVPVAGISLNRQMYVVLSTDHADDRSTDRSVLTTFTLPATFKPGRMISRLPAGHFVKMSLHSEPSAIAGMPPGGPFVLMWGTGAYRRSEAYLAAVPAAHFEGGQGTRYFAGLTSGGTPNWSERETDASPLTKNGTIGDLSVTWCAPLGLWLMTYDSRPPAGRGVMFQSSRTPWGPWSEPQTIFGPADGVGKFIHNARGNPPDTLVGPVIGRAVQDPEGTHGGAYAPYVVERWTRVQGSELTIYYVLSTWNPYVVVLMKSRFAIER
jgi:Domain of unknown function (DUF4185)